VLYSVKEVLDYMVSSILFVLLSKMWCTATVPMLRLIVLYCHSLLCCWIKCAAYSSTDAWYRQWT